MKNIQTIVYKGRVAICAIALLLISSRCSIQEGAYTYTPDNFYKTDREILSSMSGVYRNFASIPSFGSEYRVMELSADQLMVFGRKSGAWLDPNTQTLMLHTWDPNNPLFNTTWNTLFATVAQANSLIPIITGTELTEANKGPVAELRSLRAYAYFYLMDLFGNVPIYTKPTVDPLNLPNQNTRTEVFNFVVSELKDAAVDLPPQKTAGAGYYGRFTQEAAYALLATVYLNAKVYTGTEHNDDAITYTDLVINSNAYILLPNYLDNFVYNNEASRENIFGAVYTPNVTGGPGLAIVQKCLPGISGGLFGLPYVPQNGFGTRPATITKFEDNDVRKSIFLPVGPLKDPRNGQTVMVEKIEDTNTSVIYKPGISKTGPVPYTLIPADGTSKQANNAGDMWVKWGLDPNSTNGGLSNNDFALLRYADVLLIKAEALVRKNNLADALLLVNQVRERSKATPLATLTLNDIFDERGRELVFELTRRRDLIRFGKFNDAWQFKAASESFRTLFPIPTIARGANVKLEQNPGY